jgi:hypothetical protein
VSSLNQVNGGIQSSVLQIIDEEKSDLWKPAWNFGYQNRGPQAIAWQWGPMNCWPNAGFLSGDPSVPLTVFGGDAREQDLYGPWNNGISGHSRPYFIRGICKDGAGNILGGAVVYAVRASDNVMVGSVACDDRGVFECPTLDTTAHFVHSYYASGSLAGRSISTLTPTL